MMIDDGFPRASVLRRLWRRHHVMNWVLADQILVSGVNFLTTVVLARGLGIADFGRFALAWMVVLFVNALQHALIIQPMMSIGPKQRPAGQPDYYGAILAQQGLFGLAVFALVWAGLVLGDHLMPEGRLGALGLPVACAALAFQIQDLQRRYFFTCGRPALAFAGDALRYLTQIAALVWLVRHAVLDAAEALWVIGACALAAALVGAPMLDRRLGWNPAVFRAVLARHWRLGRDMAGSALLLWASRDIFTIAAGSVFGPVAVGALRAAQNLMGLTHVLLQGLQNLVPVRATHCYMRGGKRALVAYLRRATVAVMLATGAVAAVVAAIPEFWLRLLFGGEFAGYGALLRWYAVIYLLVALELPLTAALRTIEHTRPMIVAYLAGTVFALAAIHPLFIRYDLTGAVVGLLVTILIQIVLLALGLKARLKTLPGLTWHRR